LQRMVETVPKDVVFSDIVSPLATKPINATLDFDSHGNLIFTGAIRILIQGTLSPNTLTLLTSTSPKPITLTSEIATGTSVFGNTSYFPFSTAISDGEFHSFTVVGKGVAPIQFQVQTVAFVVPSLTTLKTGTSTSVQFTVAVLSNRVPSVTISAPIPQMGTLGPAIATFDNVAVTKAGTKAGYNLWHGSVDIGALTTGAVTVEIVQAGKAIDTVLISLAEF